MDSAVASHEETVKVVEKLKGQLSLALSLLASLGFDVFDLTDYLT